MSGVREDGEDGRDEERESWGNECVCVREMDAKERERRGGTGEEWGHFREPWDLAVV